MEKILSETKVYILLTYILMPVMNGAKLAKKVKNNFFGFKILALAMSGQGNLVNQMRDDSDISGYVLKNLGKQELINALEKIAVGGVYFSDEVLEEMMKASERKKTNDEVQLTVREIEIIRLIEKENNNK
jgi:two-component system, NarL family, nitrate/nitrite response regulator NarL